MSDTLNSLKLKNDFDKQWRLRAKYVYWEERTLWSEKDT